MKAASATPIRLGLIGAGSVVANYHLPVLQEVSGVRLAWITDPTVSRAQDLAKVYGIPRVTASLAECGEVDPVLVGTPVGVRKPIMETVIGRGWRALVEKPFAATTADHEWMLGLAGRSVDGSVDAMDGSADVSDATSPDAARNCTGTPTYGSCSACGTAACSSCLGCMLSTGPGSCVGNPSNATCASCGTCSACVGCTAIAGSCSGTPYACLLWNSTSANYQMYCEPEGCTWTSNDGGVGGTCSGTPAACSTNTTPTSCALSTGCSWSTSTTTCSGTLTPCSQLTSSTCGTQAGCSWSPGTSTCTGTLTPCNQLDASNCITQPGCTF